MRLMISPPTHNTPLRPDTRRGRGFSIIELLVVLLVMAVIIPLAIRFTSDSLWFTDDQAGRVRMFERVADALVTVERDLGAARSCRRSLLDPPVISISPDKLEFVADINGDGEGDYVAYEISDGAVWRTVAVAPDDTTTEDTRCAFPWTEHARTEQLVTLPEGTTGLFAASHRDGSTVTEADCRNGEWDPETDPTTFFDRCDFATVSVKLVQRSLVPDTPDLTIFKEIAIDERWGRT